MEPPMDLVERLEGDQRRLERTYPGRSDGPVEEWRLRRDAHEFRDAIDAAPETADQFLGSCLLYDGPLNRVVFLTDRHFVYCSGPESRLDVFQFDEMLVELTIRTHGSSREYSLLLDGPHDPAVLRCMLRVAALATCISSVQVHLLEGEGEAEAIPGMVPAMQDFVAAAGSRRTVTPCFRVWPEMARALVFNCSPVVGLDLYLTWGEGFGAVLAEAIRANQCPTRLTLRSVVPGFATVLAPALEATTRVEELTLHLQHHSCTPLVLDAVGRNGSIRTLIVRGGGILLCRDVALFWNAVLKSATIQSVDASDLVHDGGSGDHFSPSDRRTCAGVAAAMIRSNPRITSLRYDPRMHDVEIMESRVVPIVHCHRLRPVVESLFEGSAGGAGRDRTVAVSALIGSPLVRRHPELLHLLVKANRENVVAATGVGRRHFRRRADLAPASDKRRRASTLDQHSGALSG
jgi:hypothetical protein